MCVCNPKFYFPLRLVQFGDLIGYGKKFSEEANDQERSS